MVNSLATTARCLSGVVALANMPVGGLARSETLGWVKCGSSAQVNLLLPAVREGLTGCSVCRPLRRASPVDVLGSHRSALQRSYGVQRRCPEDVSPGKLKLSLQTSGPRTCRTPGVSHVGFVR